MPLAPCETQGRKAPLFCDRVSQLRGSQARCPAVSIPAWPSRSQQEALVLDQRGRPCPSSQGKTSPPASSSSSGAGNSRAAHAALLPSGSSLSHPGVCQLFASLRQSSQTADPNFAELPKRLALSALRAPRAWGQAGGAPLGR